MSSDPYPGGIPALLAQYEGRRDPFSYATGEALPPLDTDLAALAQQTVTDPADDPARCPPFRSSYHRKCFALRQELNGASDLVFLNALLIAHLRKRSWPDHAPALFLRLWTEQAQHLLDRLDPRWLVSSVTTFGDHGATAPQRSTGLALTTLFGAMKLYESERLYSGHSPDRAFPLDGKIRAKLPLDMDSYALASGGLDVNLIARLWQEADADPVIAPLAHRLLTLLIGDDRTVMRRLATMRKRKARQDTRKPAAPRRANIAPVPHDCPLPRADNLRWGLVATIKAPLPAIARFAAHHLELGAAALHVFLDAPDEQTARWLSRHPRIHVTQCDADYWRAIGKPRPDAHQLRQALNATRALRANADTLDWLGHVDVDEFLIPARPVADTLAMVPADCAFARIPPAEALAREDADPDVFKLTHAQAGQPKAVLQDIYPTFGLHLYGGFLSHNSGKVFARTGIPDTRLGIHTLKYRGEDATNRAKPDGLHLAHFHAPNWQHFIDHLDFRRRQGSYRPRSTRRELGQADLLAYLTAEEGEAGLRLLFDEVCTDSPALRDRLRAHDMLIEHRFDLDGAVSRVFGDLP